MLQDMQAGLSGDLFALYSKLKVHCFNGKETIFLQILPF